MAVTNIKELNELVARVKAAQQAFAGFTQEQVDPHLPLRGAGGGGCADSAGQDGGGGNRHGVIEDKVIKNHFASEYIYNKYKDEKTCGVLEVDEDGGIITIAEPIGILCGIVPTTNPTSTAIFKALIALKTRNGIVFSPHPRARRSTCAAAKLVLDAAVAAGAPADIVGWIDEPTVELSNALMRHPDINLILATGGPGMVRAAYSSGKPAIGVGAGNTLVVIDETADIKRAAASILLSKTFDNGVVCASEQSVIVVDAIYDAVKARFAKVGGYLLNEAELDAVRKVILTEGHLNADIVGQSALRIAWMAGRAGLYQGADRRSHSLGSEEAFAQQRSRHRRWRCTAPATSRMRSKRPKRWSRWAGSATPRCSTPTRTCSPNASPGSATA